MIIPQYRLLQRSAYVPSMRRIFEMATPNRRPALVMLLWHFAASDFTRRHGMASAS